MDFCTGVIEALKGHPEAVLIFALASLGVVLFLNSVNPILAVTLPLGSYGLYILRMKSKDAHEERIARIDIERLEATKGTRVRAKAKRALSQRKNGNDG